MTAHPMHRKRVQQLIGKNKAAPSAPLPKPSFPSNKACRMSMLPQRIPLHFPIVIAALNQVIMQISIMVGKVAEYFIQNLFGQLPRAASPLDDFEMPVEGRIMFIHS